MKSQRSLGLVIEGNVTASSILRLPTIVEDLGPVKAGALRVARRLSNYLRAGYAVSSYNDLQPAGLVFLRVPDAIVPRIVEEVCASELVFKDLAFVLCESWLSTAALAPLQTRGATTATLMPIQTMRKSWFVVEGQLGAVRQVRKFLQRNDARSFELRPGSKPLYFAAQLLATTLPTQLFAAAQQALRLAGIRGNYLQELLEDMSLEMFRSFSNGVRVTRYGVRSGFSPETYAEYLDYLHACHPQIASIIEEQLNLATLADMRSKKMN
jgi:hypothetical protein